MESISVSARSDFIAVGVRERRRRRVPRQRRPCPDGRGRAGDEVPGTRRACRARVRGVAAMGHDDGVPVWCRGGHARLAGAGTWSLAMMSEHRRKAAEQSLSSRVMMPTETRGTTGMMTACHGHTRRGGAWHGDVTSSGKRRGEKEQSVAGGPGCDGRRKTGAQPTAAGWRAQGIWDGTGVHARESGEVTGDGDGLAGGAHVHSLRRAPGGQRRKEGASRLDRARLGATGP